MRKQNARMTFLFITVALDMVGIGLIVPSLPDVVRRFVSGEENVSTYYGYFISLYALMQFIASPFLGALSDRFGRRPVLLVSLLMAGLDYLLMAFAPTLGWLFVGRLISGLSGASITVAMAYVADVSTDENRAKNYGYMGAAFGLGFIIGPALGGLISSFGPSAPFVLAAIMNLLNFLFGVFVLPESFPVEKRRKLSLKRMNPLSALKYIFASPTVLALAMVHFLFQLAGQTHPSIWTLYTEYRYQWTHWEVGLSLACCGVLAAIAQGWLTQHITKYFGENKTLLYSLIGEVVAFTLFGFAATGLAMYLVLVFSAVFWVGQPALQSMVSKEVPADVQGEFQGSLVSLTSLAAILNPLIVTQLFAHFTDSVGPVIPGMPYFFAAGVYAVAWVLVYRRNRAVIVG